MSKLDLPENWKVQQIAFVGPDLVLRLDNGRACSVNQSNFGKLIYDILSLGPAIGKPPDADLAAIWDRLAKYAPNQRIHQTPDGAGDP